jgi:hypothetical protein
MSAITAHVHGNRIYRSTVAMNVTATRLVKYFHAHRCHEPLPKLLWRPGQRVHLQPEQGQPLPGGYDTSGQFLRFTQDRL